MAYKLKVLMVGLGALFALSAAGTGVAQAGAPIQPQFTTANGSEANATIKSNFTIEDQSDASRLWATKTTIGITCARSTSRGTIEPKGLNSGQVTYTGCTPFLPEKNAAGQWEESSLVNCEARSISPAGGAGEIITKPLRSHLVWGEKGTEGENLVFNKFAPTEGAAFVEIEFKNLGAEVCSVKGQKFTVEGSVLGLVQTVNKEAIINEVHFEVNNPQGGEVLQRDTKWEVQQEGGCEKQA